MKGPEERFSKRALGMKGSEIRRLFRMSMKPGVISFAGGLPDPDSFPYIKAAEILERGLKAEGDRLLQYGAARGEERLIELVVERMRRKGVEVEARNVLITSGAQQALDLAAKIFMDPGDTMFVEAPTFIGALGAFRNYQSSFVGIPLDESGMRLDLLIESLEKYRGKGISPKLLYTIPNFQNPSGITLSQQRRKRLVEIAKDYDFLIVEDDAYGDLWYEGCADDVRPIKALDEDERVVYIGSFSKIVSPGIRLGWVIGSEQIIDRFEMAKQMMDVCPSPLTQALVVGLVEDGYLDDHIEELRRIYRSRRDAMLASLERYMPEGVHWTRPKGGFYIWVTLPEGTDALEIFPRAVAQNVAYVIGSAFYPDEGVRNTFRISFSHEHEDTIEEGIRRLAEVIRSSTI